MNPPVTPYDRACDARSRACYNCHVYARLIADARKWDKRMRIAAVVLSSSALVAALTAFKLQWLVVGFNVLCTVIAAVGLSDRIKRLEDLHVRYVDACNRLRNVVDQGDELDATQLGVALGMLEQLSMDEVKVVDKIDAEVRVEAWNAVITEYGLEPDAELPSVKALPEGSLTPRLE